MHYYQHHIGDFIKDTSFLTNEEVGIYLKLLWLYYDTEQPLPNSTFELSMKVNARDQQEVLSGILDMFFTLQDNEWHHTRCDKEIKHYQQQLETASRAGKASAAKRALNNNSTGVERALDSSSSVVQPTINQQPITKNQEPKKIATIVAPPVGVSDSVWQEFVAHRKSKKAKVTELVMANIEEQAKLAGWTLENALKETVVRNWQSFKADWVAPKLTSANKFDVVNTTVPIAPGYDSALRKIEEDRKLAAPPSLEVLARMAALRKEIKSA